MDLSSLFGGINGLGSNYVIARWIFLRALGVIYLIAFVSLWVQVKGLLGSTGILPIAEYLEAARAQLGPERYGIVPTVFWLSSSDVAIHLVCALGVLCSVMVIIGFGVPVQLIILWVLYLSLFKVGQDFLSFQWDTLLLETGFLAIFLAPWTMWATVQHTTTISPLVLFLCWFLLFRLMIQSGMVKLTSGDSTWWNLQALDVHYFTQPLPNPISWYMHQLPGWFHRASVLFMFVVLIGCSWFVWFPKPFPVLGAGLLVMLQLFIMLTGNYTFFNLLAIALCLLVIPDTVWVSLLPSPVLLWLGSPSVSHAVPLPLTFIASTLTVLVVYVSGVHLTHSLLPQMRIPNAVWNSISWTQNIALINSYGLFRSMTTERPEIVIEGSHDGTHWEAYEFTYKPGDLHRAPPFAQPHQPRLDWQMWFAALSREQFTPWFRPFLHKLLIGEPSVLNLLKHNPFEDQPPLYVRALRYKYTFSSFRNGAKPNKWWEREYETVYTPVLTLP